MVVGGLYLVGSLLIFAATWIGRFENRLRVAAIDRLIEAKAANTHELRRQSEMLAKADRVTIATVQPIHQERFHASGN